MLKGGLFIFARWFIYRPTTETEICLISADSRRNCPRSVLFQRLSHQKQSAETFAM